MGRRTQEMLQAFGARPLPTALQQGERTVAFSVLIRKNIYI